MQFNVSSSASVMEESTTTHENYSIILKFLPRFVSVIGHQGVIIIRLTTRHCYSAWTLIRSHKIWVSNDTFFLNSTMTRRINETNRPSAKNKLFLSRVQTLRDTIVLPCSMSKSYVFFGIATLLYSKNSSQGIRWHAVSEERALCNCTTCIHDQH